MKPEKARGVEDVILRAAQMGQIVEKVTIHSLLNSYHKVSTRLLKYSIGYSFSQVSEERLITLLEQINSQTTKQTKVTVCTHKLL